MEINNPYFRHYFLKDTFNHSSSKMQPNKPPPIMIHKAINFGNFNKLIMFKPFKTILLHFRNDLIRRRNSPCRNH